jgi:hypothetical protein
MLIDFQQHYTSEELLEGDPRKASVDLDTLAPKLKSDCRGDLWIRRGVTGRA